VSKKLKKAYFFTRYYTHTGEVFWWCKLLNRLRDDGWCKIVCIACRIVCRSMRVLGGLGEVSGEDLSEGEMGLYVGFRKVL
jgi:hypothetical protein